MKLVISTQHRENYAAHNDDYVHGVDAPHWKYKFGSTYVVNDITKSQMERIFQEGIPTLTNLIETFDDGFEEYILNWDIVGDVEAEELWEEWQAPWFLKYIDKKWVATRQPQHWTIPVEESYTMTKAGGRENYGYVEL